MDQLPAGLVARPPTMDDVEQVTAFLRAEEAHSAGESLTTASDVTAAWSRPSVDLATHAVLVFDDDELVGYADQHDGKSWGAVHPDALGRGIGTALLAWIEAAFGEWPDRDTGTTFEDWRAEHLERDDVEIIVATGSDGVLGAVVVVDEGEGEGWVEQLAVVGTHRGQGLARALLQASFRLFAQRGCTSVGLSTDSRTGAKALYERVGMQVTSTWTQWSRELT